MLVIDLIPSFWAMSAYRLYTVVPRLVKFVDILTNWYVRMNRRRLKVSVPSQVGVQGSTESGGVRGVGQGDKGRRHPSWALGPKTPPQRP